MNVILSAGVFSADKHSGQMRKELNEPYINHPIRCAALAADFGFPDEFVAGMLLHDVIEDTKTTLGQLLDAGFPTYTVNLVSVLSKWWDKTATPDEVAANKKRYYELILELVHLAPEAKMIDRIDNLRDMIRTCHNSPRAYKWAMEYLAKTLAEFPPLVNHARINGYGSLADLFDQTVTDLATELAK